MCVDDYDIYVRLMAGTLRVMIPRHFRMKRSRVNGVSDAFRPPDEARNRRQGHAGENSRYGQGFRRKCRF